MGFDIGAGGMLGVALESVPGTYTAPQKFLPIKSETLKNVTDISQRRPVRQSADLIGTILSWIHTEGDITFELLEDVLVYFLYGARMTVVKSGSTPNFTYTFTPSSAGASPVNKSLSITVVRNSIVYGYTNCMVTSLSLSTQEGIGQAVVGIMGGVEAVQSLPTAVWPNTAPYGPGLYDIQIPTASSVLDADSFEFKIEEGAEAQYRLANGVRSMQFVKYGERSVSLDMTRDYANRTDYDAYKALTAQSITIIASKGANNSVSILMPSSIKSDYAINIGGQGDLLRAATNYIGQIDSTGKAAQIVVKTQENIT